MNTKLMSVFVVIALAALSNGLPTDQSKELDTFLAKVNGTTCFSDESLPPQFYEYCFNVCYNRNGVQVCYRQCNYSDDKQAVGSKYDAKCSYKYICLRLPNGQQACDYVCI